MEKVLHHRLLPAERAATINIGAGLLNAIEMGWTCRLVFGDGEPVELPPSLRDAMLDLASLLAIEEQVSLILLGSRRQMTIGTFQALLGQRPPRTLHDVVPSVEVGGRRFYDAGQMLDAIDSHPDRRGLYRKAED